MSEQSESVQNAPHEFSAAVASLGAVPVRPEVQLEPIRPPDRLAPWSYALGAEVVCSGEEMATGRLVLLHDPAGHEAWGGTLRLVSYVTADLDPEMAGDPMLAGVGWSWLVDALESYRARYTAVGGTVTQTASTRFGDIAGPETSIDIELRASWTPLDPDLVPHVRAWMDVLSAAAGLPPPGVSQLTPGPARPVLA
ncbi:MAG: DUF3000 domain-containing protein [Geodermatophilaceae bacterium]|nr:DUF3000 domain-containing protein [Geodermatophilaceae bacterium]